MLFHSARDVRQRAGSPAPLTPGGSGTGAGCQERPAVAASAGFWESVANALEEGSAVLTPLTE